MAVAVAVAVIILHVYGTNNQRQTPQSRAQFALVVAGTKGREGREGEGTENRGRDRGGEEGSGEEGRQLVAAGGGEQASFIPRG